MVKPGGVVVDVGINRTETGIVGDVDAGALEVASLMTPVPRGVGPDDDRVPPAKRACFAPAIGVVKPSIHGPNTVLSSAPLRPVGGTCSRPSKE